MDHRLMGIYDIMQRLKRTLNVRNKVEERCVVRITVFETIL